jgi:DedD protein
MLSIFKRRAETGSNAGFPSESADEVQAARTRARRRLIGAAVLVAIGVIGFPLVFETQPRPIPVDIPIELPRKDNVPPLAMPPPRAAAPTTSASGRVAEPSTAIITESRDEAGARDTAASAASAPAVAKAGTKPEPKPPVPTADTAAAKAHPEASKPTPADAESVRARALLEGKPAPAADSGRFVVQVGAFADAGAARETRLKVEKLGLKTYTQVASTAAGDRIRVRVGPFATRDEADRALAKARSAGLSGVVLTL